MQTIVHSDGFRYSHPIFDEFDMLYTELSNNDGGKQLVKKVFETSLQPFEDIFNHYGNCARYLSYSDKNYKAFPRVKYNKKNIIVAFSGGKDSTATALYYKHKGFNVYLYHVHGLNRFFPYEQQSAEKVAEYLQLPIIIENASLKGNSLYPDHPLKNIIISNMALQWGIDNGIGVRIAFGDYYTNSLDDVCFETSGDDCKEFWQVYRKVIKQYIPQFKLETPLENLLSTLESLKSDKELLGLTQSCVMTHRFKQKYNQFIQNKYKVKLLPNRCGVCWKCILEYFYYCDHDVLEYDKDYYQYCLGKIFRSFNDVVSGDLPKTIQELWSSLLFYPIEESQLYPEIETYEIDTWKKKIWFEPKKYNV